MATIRLELTGEQKEQVRAATGREVNRLELRLREEPEPAADPEGAALPWAAAGPAGEPAAEPSPEPPTSRQRSFTRGTDSRRDRRRGR
jgi:hypothetical protein